MPRAPDVRAAHDAGAPATHPAGRHWLDSVGAATALAVPLLVTLGRATPGAQWAGDLALVRSLGLVPVGADGSLSLALGAVASLLPLGGRVLRVALPAAIAVGLAGLLTYRLARRALAAAGTTPRLTPPLALAGALLAVLASPWQLHGTIAGGATIAAALCLLAIDLGPVRGSDARLWGAQGALLAAAALESRAAGVAVLLALAARGVALGSAPTRRELGWLAAGSAATALLLLAPAWLRPLSGRAFVDLGVDLADVRLERDGPSPASALGLWVGDVGIVSLALAAAGAAIGLFHRASRPAILPLTLLVSFDAVSPAVRGGLLIHDPFAAPRLLALAALGVLAAAGVHRAVLALLRVRVPLAQPASVLLVVFTFTLVLVTAEDASYAADRREQRGADAFTEEALGGAPPRAIILVRSEPLAWRLWAARAAHGARPDVVVVPVPLLHRGSVARRLVEAEPLLAPLIRDYAVQGRTTEHALSSLADARPLLVERDPDLDPRLVDHLVPHGAWLELRAHALGRSDRTTSLAGVRATWRRAVAAVRHPRHRDRATEHVIASRLRDQIVTLVELGDRESGRALLDELRLLDPSHPAVEELERGSFGARGPVATVLDPRHAAPR
ncbi:MAG: hypothetical protein IT376_17870 [Polyangiaceae bacterium]|nr:hypothetical protein [Polyangiaceae bacterium]